ncbi:hypothetical protein LCGC14_0521470 [marine sediment metagenome]|uniref:DNA methylase N-4/N-6 domain-containing protein n=1 Tax=marine sediment metagenome TaxID=412755 RepID=A0A0F9SGU3_9ZZZZ
MIKFIIDNILNYKLPNKIALIICDPPYGTGKIQDSASENKIYGKVRILDDRDIKLPLDILKYLLSYNKPLCFFSQINLMYKLGQEQIQYPDKIIYWKSSWISGFKSNSCLPNQIEIIYCFNLNIKNIISQNNKTIGNLISDNKYVAPRHRAHLDRKLTIHQSQKPEYLGKLLAATFSNKKDLILDACCGSGALGKGANTASGGRDIIFIDNDPMSIRIAKINVKEAK